MKTIDLYVYFRTSPKYMKKHYTANCIIILKIYLFQVKEGYSGQHCLLVMTEKFKEAIDRGDKFGAVLNGLSKAFGCINHPLLTVTEFHLCQLKLFSFI